MFSVVFWGCSGCFPSFLRGVLAVFSCFLGGFCVFSELFGGVLDVFVLF